MRPHKLGAGFLIVVGTALARNFCRRRRFVEQLEAGGHVAALSNSSIYER
jgi:hypothetical protein